MIRLSTDGEHRRHLRTGTPKASMVAFSLARSSVLMLVELKAISSAEREREALGHRQHADEVVEALRGRSRVVAGRSLDRRDGGDAKVRA